MAGRFTEIPIEIGGQRYRYYLGHYGLAALERSTGQPWPKVIARAMSDGWGFDIALSLFHAGLVFHHETMTVRQASLLLDEYGFDRFAEVFATAMQALKDDSEGASDRPPLPATVHGNGTGLSSNG